MSCSSCNNSPSCNCKKIKAMDVDTPANNIANGDKNYCFSGITDKVCENLANDEGIHPSVTNHNSDCEDLKSLTDLGIGSLHNGLMKLDMCDIEALKRWLFSLLSWLWNLLYAIICAICGLWKTVKCIDGKTRQAVRVVKLWEGEKDIFTLPTIDVTEDMNQFDYLDLHVLCGTERVVTRMSLASGMAGIPTNSLLDRIGRNTSYGMGDGAIAAKELGIGFDNSKRFHVDHFLWSVTGCYPSSLNKVEAAKFITFGSTSDCKKYNDTQDTVNDRPHKILQVDGIISKDTGSCIK